MNWKKLAHNARISDKKTQVLSTKRPQFRESILHTVKTCDFQKIMMRFQNALLKLPLRSERATGVQAVVDHRSYRLSPSAMLPGRQDHFQSVWTTFHTYRDASPTIELRIDPAHHITPAEEGDHSFYTGKHQISQLLIVFEIEHIW